MAERAIHRYHVDVNDEWQVLAFTGDIVHVAARSPHYVEIWAFVNDHAKVARELRVFGTGQPIPTGHHGAPLHHVGTALVEGHGLVRHVMQRMASAGANLPRISAEA